MDRVVTWAKWLRKLSFCKMRPWGEMGRYGYLGGDIGVVNTCTAHDCIPPALGHSGVFGERVIGSYISLFIGIAKNVIK